MTRMLPWSFVYWAFLLFSCLSPSLAGQEADEATLKRYSLQAEEALARKDVDAAVIPLEKLARLTPNNPEVFANLGAVYYTQGRYAQAADAFQRALHLNPKLPNGLLMLAICDAKLGHFREALPTLESAFRHPPGVEMGRTIGLTLAVVYTSLDQPTKALEVIEALLNRFPNDPEVLYRASRLHGDRALQTMRRLVEVAPDSSWKHLSYAEVLETQKRYDLAIIEYRKVIRADPEMPGVHYELGRTLLLKSPDREEARDEALKEFQQDLALDPRNSAAEYEIGEICRRRGQLELAIDHLSRAVDIDPETEEAQIALARTLMQLHKPDKALPHLHDAIRLNPKNAVSHFLLAGAYKSLGDATDYQNEMVLFQKYHLRRYTDKPAGGDEEPSVLGDTESTKQTLDSEPPPQP